MLFLQELLVVSLIPYFLEKDGFWFEQNVKKILKARKTQPFLRENTLCLNKGGKLDFSQALRKLDEMGFEKVFEVQDPGEFSQRGGILDLFPINSNCAARIEFFGNQVESIRSLENIKTENIEKAKDILKKKLKSQKLFSDLKGLKPGEYLVHLDHGIGKFAGWCGEDAVVRPALSSAERLRAEWPVPAAEQSFSLKGKAQYYLLEYAQKDRLYVPVGLERKLSRYVGFVEPKISRLGSSFWQKTKRKIKQEAENFAKELLEIYAKRTISLRPPYLKEDEIDFELANNFKYEETPDQIQTIEEIKKDLEKEEPMDRIVCGDVGFGKTEIALRAMIKAVNSGYQASMICPTTILANQHFQNFKQRLANLPVRVAILSRLQPKKEQKETIEGLKQGKIDILIGTHRVLSKDLEEWLAAKIYNQATRQEAKEKGLGLLVIDDEQKFGVKQKEKFKKIRASLDVLSLSATPIPRTLSMSLSSLKNISLMLTPPEGRLPVKTFVLPFSKKIIKKSVENELSRKGQVYYLHNRIQTIEAAKNSLEKLLPEAKFGFIHGKLKEKELIKTMEDFQKEKINVLIATTIIENGLDLPNANTLIVADATRLGLAQAYQIRGRIGRSHLQSFAYFLYPHRRLLSEPARERLNALKEADELGSGYRIALKDLEIRGAGNILGKEQSGNINKVGFNLYCQMLSEAIEKLKGSEFST